MRSLSIKERLLLIMYYVEGITMKKVGEALDLSESRISQMHTDLIARLRERLVDRHEELAA
jgi:RNA polymerase sigma factor for flagellar operon FliA